jgi:ABC-type branched-subunit amino acid transport system substrate-binding protein
MKGLAAGSILRRWLALLAPLVVVALAMPSGQAQAPGVTSDAIKIGSCSALEGPARFLGTQTVLGATAYIHYVNDRGGIYGRKINLLAFDDSYDPEKAPTCFKRMTSEGVFALGFFVGTSTAAKYIPMAEEAKIPVVGLFTGAQLLYEPLKHYVVNVRASYYDETREQVDKLWKELGIHKIGVIYQDDAFGKTVLDGVKLALQRHHSAPVALGTFARNTLDVDSGLKAVMAERPQAVVVVGPYAPVAEVVKRAHAAGWFPKFLTVSFVGTEEFIKEAGKDAEGTIITQVVPPYERLDFPTVGLYRQALKDYAADAPPSFASLEGFVDAMVLVEGLKRAGKEPTREKLISGIESIHHWNAGLGGEFLLDYSPTDHKGFERVYPTVVRGGLPVIISDWKTIAK